MTINKSLTESQLMNSIKPFLTLLLLSLSVLSFGQRNVKDSTIFSPHISLSYAYQVPGGDLSDRFGNNSSIGIAFDIKTKKNIYYGFSGAMIFGKRVRQPGLLQNLVTDDGEIIADDGKLALVLTQERGYVISAEAGKIFNFIGKNPNSGLLIKGGIGFIQHKIRLEHQNNKISQLEDEYLKGYDRLTNGWQLNEFIGYYHQGNSRTINFYIGLEAYQGFTQGRRSFNFDTLSTDDTPRTDLLMGIRVGWIIHLYGRAPDDFYYN